MSATVYLTPKLKEGESVDLSLYSPRERTSIRLYGLACKDWGTTDVYNYRQSWQDAGQVVVVRGKLDKSKHWCKEHLYMQDWSYDAFASQDNGHNFYFKDPKDAMMFKMSI